VTATTAMKFMKILALSAGSLLSVSAGFASEWIEQPLKFTIQSPYDLQQGDRYTFKDGVYDFVVHKTDQPFQKDSSTLPRTEMRIDNNYKSGRHMFEADVFVPTGTTGVSIMQIFGGSNGHASSLQLRVDDGNLMRYHSDTVKSNIYDHWFHLNVVHDDDTHDIAIFIDGVQVLTAKDLGGSSHYFKCGVYTQEEASDKMEARFKNIKIYSK
jgi:hypothetical protein